MSELWNQKYAQVTYNCVKRLYVDKFELGVRILNPSYVTVNNNTPPIQYDQASYEIMSIELDLKTDDPIFKYWFEDLNKMMQLYAEHFYAKINKKFAFERNMYANGTAALTPIDADIQWLLMLNMCHQSAFRRYEYCWKLLKDEPRWEHNIRKLSTEMMNSLKHFNKSLNYVIQKISSRRDYFIESNKDQSWSNESSAAFVEMQVWFDDIRAVICDTCQLIENMRLRDPVCCNDEFKQIKHSLGLLLNLTVVLEQQPPEIVKTETNFSSKIRILLTLNKLDISALFVTIHHNITPHFQNEECAGKMKNIPKFEFEINEHDVYSKYDKLKVCEGLERIRDKGSVIENRYVLKYCLNLRIFKIKYTASIISRSIFVIVHKNQEAMANAANIWDKHFSDIDRIKNQSVPWSKMCVVLKIFFKNITGCELNDGHLYALHAKTSQDKIIDGENFLWKPSCKSRYKNIVKANNIFSFWEWFYEIMKIVRDHIKPLWEKGLVHGFVNETALNQLLDYRIGTFLLRFSDSVPGAITIIGVECNPENGMKQIYRVGPILIENFATKNHSKGNFEHIPFTDIIRSLELCTYLCDGTPKDQAFHSFYEKSNTRKDVNTEKYKFLKLFYGTEDTQTLVQNTPVATYSQNPSGLNGFRSYMFTSPTLQHSPTQSISFGSSYSITPTSPVQSPLSVTNFVEMLNNGGVYYDTDDSLCRNGEDSIMKDVTNSNGMESTTVPTFSVSFSSKCHFKQLFNSYADEGNYNWQTSYGNDQNHF
ncbi:signal transducer and transcription activator-like [Contarinia nasturtii]|uniref:signal transducer and transcription activator-like n=1 Tax=Contarinia nasturtii TaxID=265458 RepID=UPI0012D49752|nr:signal transducer and transcription activator-like [Contarinia nasturtii]